MALISLGVILAPGGSANAATQMYCAQVKGGATGPFASALMATSPVSVNLIALPTKLFIEEARVLDGDVIVARGISPEEFVGHKGAGEEFRNAPTNETHEVRGGQIRASRGLLPSDRDATARLFESRSDFWRTASAADPDLVFGVLQ
jgi:hypothetical protein